MSRKLAFYMALGAVFVKFSLLAEIQAHLTGFNGYLLYVFGIPAMLGVVAAGGLGRAMAGRTARYWLAFGLWMAVCIPFSTWRGDSFRLVLAYFRTTLPIMLMISGLVVKWQECNLL